jgi:iron complex outermembrane receptor protein
MAFQRAIITQADPNNLASQGKEMNHVPHRIYSLGVDYQATPDLKLSVSANGQSSYYLERTNSTGKFGGYNLLNFSAAYQLRRDTSLEFIVKNLADRYYEYVWYDSGAGDLHSRGDGRAAYATVNVKF